MKNKNYILEFIKEEDFEKNVREVIKSYDKFLKKMDLSSFNKNIIDPIKLIFDKNIYKKTYEIVILDEIKRQIDKSNNNAIGFFHQNIFKYIKNCEVPSKGWDIIFRNGKENYFIEMKNKHNTMNSSSASETFKKMSSFLLNEKSQNNICALVEVISRKSVNEPWKISIRGEVQNHNNKIKKISIDVFYEIVTGDSLAFKKICLQLPRTLEKIMKNKNGFSQKQDLILESLAKIHSNLLVAFYKMAFSTYLGFEKIEKDFENFDKKDAIK